VSSRLPVEQSACALAQGVPVRLKDLMTVKEVACELSCSVRYVQKLMARGAFKIYKPSKTFTRVHRSSLLAHIESMSSGGLKPRRPEKGSLHQLHQAA